MTEKALESPSALPLFAGGGLLSMTVRSEHPASWRLVDMEKGKRWRPVLVDQRFQWVEVKPNES